MLKNKSSLYSDNESFGDRQINVEGEREVTQLTKSVNLLSASVHFIPCASRHHLEQSHHALPDGGYWAQGMRLRQGGKNPRVPWNRANLVAPARGSLGVIWQNGLP